MSVVLDQNRERVGPQDVQNKFTKLEGSQKSVSKPHCTSSLPARLFENKGQDGKEESSYKLENDVESEKSREMDSLKTQNWKNWSHGSLEKQCPKAVRGSQDVFRCEQVKGQFLNSEGWPYSPS